MASFDEAERLGGRVARQTARRRDEAAAGTPGIERAIVWFPGAERSRGA